MEITGKSAVRARHAVLFRLDYGSKGEIYIMKEFDQFVDISCIYGGTFAVVSDISYPDCVILLPQFG